mmetsp:Transcript_22722/g.76663  ORF Transcript_22722/g.76663 Transcript_22722/m.76663 type:complete len:388 (+) Transcript_22722:1165-2328(+)
MRTGRCCALLHRSAAACSPCRASPTSPSWASRSGGCRWRSCGHLCGRRSTRCCSRRGPAGTRPSRSGAGTASGQSFPNGYGQSERLACSASPPSSTRLASSTRARAFTLAPRRRRCSPPRHGSRRGWSGGSRAWSGRLASSSPTCSCGGRGPSCSSCATRWPRRAIAWPSSRRRSTLPAAPATFARCAIASATRLTSSGPAGRRSGWRCGWSSTCVSPRASPSRRARRPPAPAPLPAPSRPRRRSGERSGAPRSGLSGTSLSQRCCRGSIALSRRVSPVAWSASTRRRTTRCSRSRALSAQRCARGDGTLPAPPTPSATPSTQPSASSSRTGGRSATRTGRLLLRCCRPCSTRIWRASMACRRATRAGATSARPTRRASAGCSPRRW